SEWKRIECLFQRLQTDDRIQFVRPSQVLDLMQSPNAGNRLQLETPQDPVPVKKQEKYNLNRWAVTGRNDLAINTACHRIYESLRKQTLRDDDCWRELCYLWASDFRTHITEKRWTAYLERLKRFEKRLGIHPSESAREEQARVKPASSSAFRIGRTGRWLHVESNDMK